MGKNIWLCRGCGKEFYSSSFRAMCYVCKPPKIRGDMANLVVDIKEGFLSLARLSEKYATNHNVVTALEKLHGLHRRCGSKLDGSKCVLDLDFMDGWLLGDGNLRCSRDSINACAQHSSSYLEYSRYILGKLGGMGLKMGESPPYLKKDGHMMYSIHSRANSVLTEQWRRWYPSGTKVVPGDVRINAISLREWYIGDGTLDPRSGTPCLVVGGGELKREEVDLLCERLCSIFGQNFRLYPCCGKGHIKDYWRLAFVGEAASKFFGLIGGCPLDCYSYKWPGEV